MKKSGLNLLIKQMRYRKTVTFLLFAALCGVASLYTFVNNSSRFHNRSIQLIMKNTGHNLFFVHESATPLSVFTLQPELPLFSEKRIETLVGDRSIASTYWANVLQSVSHINGRDVIITGVKVVDDHQVTEEKAHLFEPLPEGYADLGYSLALFWKISEGDTVSLQGDRNYIVRKVVPQRGGIDDERLWIPLADAQQILNEPGKANLIMGFLCMRGLSLEAGLERLRANIEKNHDDLKVIPVMNLLEARELSRLTTSSYIEYLLFLVILVTGLLMAVVGWLEVNERRYELAVFLSMGASYRFLFLLLLGKLLFIAAAASIAGFLTGSYWSVSKLSGVLVVHTIPVSFLWNDFINVLLLASGLVTVSALVPLFFMLKLDPAYMLAED